MARKQDKPATRKRFPKGGNDELKKFKHDYSKDYADKSWPYHHGKMDKGAKIILFLFPIFVATVMLYFYQNAQLREAVRLPLSSPNIIQQNEADMSRFWGSYRPNLYFGLKTKSPNSPVAGLMWLPQFNMGQSSPQLRHWCDQNDKLPMYGWFTHDAANFGVQEIYDTYFTVTTSFVKRPGGTHGGDWTARIIVNPRPGAEKAVVSLFFYMALDGEGQLEGHSDSISKRLSAISGRTKDLGGFNMHFLGEESSKLKYNHYITYARDLDVLKENLMNGFVRSYMDKSRKEAYIASRGVDMPEGVPIGQANFVVHQVTGQLPFTLEVAFESASNTERPNQLSGPVYDGLLNQFMAGFNTKFEETFHLEEKGFDSDRINFAKAALSNMIGGIGYFYGSSRVRSQYTGDETLDYWEAPLYTAVPSRSFFPRGFLWDEGFHNMLIHTWDERVSMDIIGHWLDLMNSEGWIPREQILGAEARARTPDEYIPQHNQNANPPTLFLPLQPIVKRLIQSSDPADQRYLKALFPRLQTWYNWFNVTQVGPKPSTYRWHGRDATAKRELNPKTLTSGLDDYPRASHPSDEEYHVDLRCWMALASSVMADIAKAVDEPWQEYAATHARLADNTLLNSLHWSEAAQRYSDYGLHTDSVKLERPPPPAPKPGQRPPPAGKKERVTKKAPVYRHVDTTFGYVSLFPFLVKIIEPDSLKLGKLLADLQDPNLLWTDYGLRSLAKNSPLYKKHNTEDDPPYWRGNIWININYLTLGALHHYSKIEGPYQSLAQSIYTDLRKNIIDNLYNQFKLTGYVWEHYNDVTGTGGGAHPFTGWSGLVVAIMAEEF